jgi:hypothetical protein
MKRFALIAALAAAATTAVAQDATKRTAAPQAVVEAVQMPAWIERGGARVPPAPGMGLQSNDALRTMPTRAFSSAGRRQSGSSARMQLRLATIQTRRDTPSVGDERDQGVPPTTDALRRAGAR